MKNKKNVFKKALIYIARIIIIILFLNILYGIQFTQVEPNSNVLNDFMTLGLNTPFIKENLNNEEKLRLDYFKIILTTSIIFSTYIYTIKVMNNLLNGLSSIIRNKSNNLWEYKKRVLKFVKNYVLLDVLALFIAIISLIFIKSMQNMFTIDTAINLIKIFLFYTIIPLGLTLIITRIEFFVSLIASLTIISIILIYQMNFITFIISMLIYILSIILIIIYKESKN